MGIDESEKLLDNCETLAQQRSCFNIGWCNLFGRRTVILLPLFVAAVFLGFVLDLSTVERQSFLSTFPLSKPQTQNEISQTPQDKAKYEVNVDRQSGNWRSAILFNITDFHWIRNNRSLCSPDRGHENSYVLPILVHSARSHFLERMAIRKSWGSVRDYKSWSIRVIFLLGESNSNVEPKTQIEEERNLHLEDLQFGDLVQGNFVDSYRNLTYKHMMGYKWILNFCRNAEFVLKTDDDIFIDLVQVLKWRTNEIERKADEGKSGLLPDLYCSTFVGTKPQRCVGCKWYASEADWKLDYYPDYCSGLCYGITVDLIRKLYGSLHSAKFFWVDDVFATGMLLEEYKKTLPGFEPVYRHLWGQVRYLDFRNYRVMCERNDMIMKRKFGVVVPIARGSHLKRDMTCLWNKTLYDEEEISKNIREDESVENQSSEFA